MHVWHGGHAGARAGLARRRDYKGDMEQTLVILKPDAVQRGLIGRIIARFEDKGLRIVAMKMMTISRELAGKHYEAHQGKPFYPALMDFITAGPVVAMVLAGPQAISVTRALMGPTRGWEAPPGTIRGDFGVSATCNLVHGSDSPESARREIALFFGPEEIVDWEPADVRWLGL